MTEQVQTEHGIASSFRSDQQEKPLDESIRTLLYQALNELLVNVVKHSQAGRVSVSCTQEGDFVRIEVEDDGIGFEPAAGISGRKLSAGFGLFSIRERLNYVKGTLEVISSSGKGTRLIMKAPLKKTEVSDNQ